MPYIVHTLFRRSVGEAGIDTHISQRLCFSFVFGIIIHMYTRSERAHISLDLNVRGCVKFERILMRNVTKIGVSSSFGVLGSIKQKLNFLTQNQLQKVIFLESDKT